MLIIGNEDCYLVRRCVEVKGRLILSFLKERLHLNRTCSKYNSAAQYEEAKQNILEGLGGELNLIILKIPRV